LHGKRFAMHGGTVMGSDYLGDVYTLADIASAADSTEAEARLAAASSRNLWSYDDAVRIGRLLVASRYAASTRLEAPLFSQAAVDGNGLSSGIPAAAVSGSLHLGLLGILLIAFGLAPRAATTAADERTNVPSRLVFLATPGPGGGGGGGGTRQNGPPPPAESKGHQPVASPLPEREPPQPAMAIPKPEAPQPLAAEPLPPVIAPIVAAAADARDRAGLLEQATAKKKQDDSRGAGIGGGTGSGAGVGIGEGSGAGVGPGTGGGVGGGPYRAGSGITPPRLLHEVKADYTEEARRRGLTGEVVLEIVVRRDGSVGDVRLLHGLDRGLDERAIQAVRQWQFVPADRMGVAVDVVVEVGVEFRFR
jgi:TonB family protein